MELELHVGTVVDKLRQDCIIIQDYTAIGAEQTISSNIWAALGNPEILKTIMQSMCNPPAIRAEKLAKGHKELETSLQSRGNPLQSLAILLQST